MDQGQLLPVDDVSVAAWIAPRLGPLDCRVNCAAPSGFEAYARVLHPTRDVNGRSVTWAEVCAATGKHAHATMQWHAIAGQGPALLCRLP